MAEINEISIPEPERQRQAIAAIRGYVYQIHASTLAWASLAEDETLLLEVAEDFATIVRESLTMVQIKDAPTGPATTLRSPGVIQTINAHWRFRTANPRLKVRSVYLTTGSLGRERSSPFEAGLNGLDAWRRAAIDGGTVDTLRGMLLTLPLDADLIRWLETATDDVLREELFRSIHWEAGRPDLKGLDDLLSERLILIGDRLGLLPSDARRARDALLVAVMRRIVDSDARRLTRVQFLETFEAATCLSVSASALRSIPAQSSFMATASLSELLTDVRIIPFPPLTLERAAAADAILEDLKSGRTVWLHGGSGLGKTTLAAQAARKLNRTWHLVEFRHQEPAAVAARLRAVRAAVAFPDFGGLILDDLPTALSGALQLQVSLLALAVRRADGGLIATAYRQPPPSIVAVLDPLEVRAAPDLDEKEIGEMVSLAGGASAVWKRVVWLTSRGHPQLAAARITGLKARGWPNAEQLANILPDLRDEDIDAERDAVRERLLQELPTSARALLYRLSLPLSGFDRALVMAMAGAPPPLAQPGEALDMLIGPWIETPRPDRYRVSPLVSDAGSKSLSAEEQLAVHRAICEDIIERRPIPGEHLHQLFLSGFLAGHAEALRVVAISVITSRDSDRAAVVTALEPLTFLRTDRPILESDADVSALMRFAQLKIAVAASSRTLTKRIFDRALVEAETGDRGPALRQSAIFTVLMADVCPLDPEEWFPLLGVVDDAGFELPSGQRARLRQQTGLAGLERPGAFLFLQRMSHLVSVSELEKLFSVLAATEPDVRKRYLGYIHQGEVSLRACVQAPWINESDQDGFEPIKAAEPYIELERIAFGWGETDLAIECVAARSTLLSEYAASHDEAIALLDEADKRWPNAPRLQRERMKIAFRLGRDYEVVELTRQYLARDVADPIDRAHALRDLAVSTAKIGDRIEAILLFGQAATVAADVPTMEAMHAGLLADKAHLEFETGQKEAALRTYFAAAPILDKLDPTTERGGFVLRVSIGVGAWMVNRLAGGDDSVVGARLGVCSGAVLQTEWPNPVPPKEAAWYQAAAIERQLSLDIGVRDAVEQRVRDRRITAFEVTFSFDRLQDAALGGTVDDLVIALVNVARIVAFMDRIDPIAINEMIHDASGDMPWDGLPVNISDARIRVPVEDAILLFTAAGLSRDPDFSPARLADRLAATDGLESLEPIVRNWDQALTVSLDGVEATFAALAAAFGPPLGDGSALMLASYRIWEWTGRLSRVRTIVPTLCHRVAEQWLYMAEQGQFAFRSPALYAPAIRLAARQVNDPASLARLLLAARHAVSLKMGDDVRRSLEEAAG